jgi:hypothetical protein
VSETTISTTETPAEIPPAPPKRKNGEARKAELAGEIRDLLTQRKDLRGEIERGGEIKRLDAEIKGLREENEALCKAMREAAGQVEIRRSELYDNFMRGCEEMRKKYPDFDMVTSVSKQWPAFISDAVLDCPNSAAVAYAIGRAPELYAGILAKGERGAAYDVRGISVRLEQEESRQTAANWYAGVMRQHLQVNPDQQRRF